MKDSEQKSYYWRKKAETVRILADDFTDVATKRTMEGIAVMYETMADNIERDPARKSPQRRGTRLPSPTE
jgi:hypothetical protein